MKVFFFSILVFIRNNKKGDVHKKFQASFTPCVPSHLSGPQKNTNFFYLSIQKQGQNSLDTSIQITHSYYLCHNLFIVHSCSRKYCYSFANLRVSKIACVENKFFIYLSHLLKKTFSFQFC